MALFCLIFRCFVYAGQTRTKFRVESTCSLALGFVRCLSDLSINLPEEEINRLLSEEFTGAIEAFVAGALLPVLPSLQDIKPLPRPSRDNDRNRRRERPRHQYNVNIGTLQAIYSFLGEQPLPMDKNERQECIELWREILRCFLETVQPDSEEEAELEVRYGFYEADKWLLQAVASLILQMQPDEKPETFWQSILDLGWTAHHFIEHFLLCFFLHHLDKLGDAGLRQRFVKVWSEMFTYASQVDGWNKKPSNRDVSELWQSLLGLKWFRQSPWNEEHQAIIKEMFLVYKTFCAERLGGPETTKKYLQFLQCPGAKLIRLESLLWVEPILQDWFFTDQYSSIEASLANLVVTCWSEHEAELRATPDTFECYKRLVRKLINLQNPMAMELQAKIIKS